MKCCRQNAQRICPASSFAEQILVHSAYDSEAVMAFDLDIILSYVFKYRHIFDRSRDFDRLASVKCLSR